MYRFNVRGFSDFFARVDNLNTDVRMTLRNANGQVMRVSTATGAVAKIVYRRLKPGTYFMDVRQKAGGSNYDLHLFAQKDQGGNSLGSASVWGNLTGMLQVRDLVGATDSSDFFAFNHQGGGPLGVMLSGLYGNLDLNLYDANGVLAASSTQLGTANEAINLFNASAGTYFVQVFNVNGSASVYDLLVNMGGDIVEL